MEYLTEAIVLSLFSMVSANVTVYSQKTHSEIEMEFRDQPADFGPSIPTEGIQAFVVYAEPANACSQLDPPPNVTNFTGKWAVLIKHYDCSFEDKVRRAQNASYDIAIVHNVNSSELEVMHARNPDGILIPSIFIDAPTGLILKKSYQYSMGFYVIIDNVSPSDKNQFWDFLITATILFGLYCIAKILIEIIKCIWNWRRARRHRIRDVKFRKGGQYETCAICLEDYVQGENLRVLPCSHAYHCACIDHWLIRKGRVCPLCKTKIFVRESRSETDSSTDDDDNTPLVNSSRRTTNGGTFTNDLGNSARRHSFSSFPTGDSQQAGPSSSQGSVNQRPPTREEGGDSEDSSTYTLSVEIWQPAVDSDPCPSTPYHDEEAGVHPRHDETSSMGNEPAESHKEHGHERNCVIV